MYGVRRGAQPDSGPHGALGPVRATPRMPPPPGLPPTPEELASLRSKYGDSDGTKLSHVEPHKPCAPAYPTTATRLPAPRVAAAAAEPSISVAESSAPTHDDATTLDAALARLARLDVGLAARLFERVPRPALPRLAIVGSGAPIRDADAVAALARMRAILDVGAPLTLLWDLTKFSLPSRKQAKLGVEWAGANAQDLDRGLQGIAIVVGSPVIRSVAAFFVRVLKPPQPMCVCASVEEATAFAEERARACATGRQRTHPGTNTYHGTTDTALAVPATSPASGLPPPRRRPRVRRADGRARTLRLREGGGRLMVNATRRPVGLEMAQAVEGPASDGSRPRVSEAWRHHSTLNGGSCPRTTAPPLVVRHVVGALAKCFSERTSVHTLS